MEQTPQFILREILAVSCFVAAVLFALISMKKDGREHFLRVCALFLVGVVALFANSAYTYFAAVFIIATAVTQLEFLQNLAAIIRGSKEYFEYQKETQSRSDVKSKIDQEIIEEEVASASDETESDTVVPDPGIQYSSGNVMLNLSAKQMDYRSFAMVAYEFTLNTLEEKYGKTIDRYPRFVGSNGRRIEFDGILENDSKITVFEIKTTFKFVMPGRFLKDQISRIIQSAIELGKYKNKAVEVQLIYVVFDEKVPRSKERLVALQLDLQEEFGSKHFNAEVVTYDSIGLGVFAKEMQEARKANK